MSPDTLIKILSFFNKPFHFLIAGIIILIVAEKEYNIWGWLLIGLSIASFIEWCFNKIKEKINKKQKELKEKEEIKQEKANLYKAYDNLNWDEKIIIFTCVHDNNIVYIDSLRFKEKELLALQIKGFGQRDGFEKFVIKPQYFKWLSEYEEVEKDYEYYYSDEEEDNEDEEA